MHKNNNSTTETLLLKRLRAGERAAFDEWVRNDHEALVRVASAIVGPASAEEVVQDAWLAAIRHLHKFEGRSSLKTWLTSIVVNQAKTRLRKIRREISLDQTEGNVSLFSSDRFDHAGHWAPPPNHWHDESPEALLSHDDFRRCLEKTLETLPEQQRTVLLLRDEEQMPLHDICNILEVSASNVRVLIHRARIRLHAMIEHFEETGTC